MDTTDPYILAKDDLIDAYEKLSNKHDQLKRLTDLDKQQIHELKRSLQTATNGEAFLANELEALAAVHQRDVEELHTKHRIELDEYKNRNSALQVSVGLLECEVETLKREVGEIEAAKQLLEQQNNVSVEDADSKAMVAELTERMRKVETENADLFEANQKLRDQLNASMKKIIQNETHIDDLTDRLQCVDENFQSKKEELDEKNQLYETMQERLIELSTELASFKSESDTANKRGNSLFAEVDDQRQRMKQQLASQKKHYLQMKKEYNDSQHEIRRLKRENEAIQKEIQICSAMFMNADSYYKDKLNERIFQLMTQLKELQTKLRTTEQNLIETASGKGINWLDAMFTSCKNETDDLKSQLYACRLQKSIIDENFRNSQQELSKWRFEALKSRCVIINRETMLEENNIPFVAVVENVEKLVRKIDNENSKPNVFDNSNALLRPTAIAIAVPPSRKSIEVQQKPIEVQQKPFEVEKPIDDVVKMENNDKENQSVVEKDEQKHNSKPVLSCVDINKILKPTNVEENIAKVEQDSKIDLNLSNEDETTCTFLTEYRNISISAQRISKINEISKMSSSIKLDENTTKSTLLSQYALNCIETRKNEKSGSSTIDNLMDDLKPPPMLTFKKSPTESKPPQPQDSAVNTNKFIVKRVVVKSKVPKNFPN